MRTIDAALQKSLVSVIEAMGYEFVGCERSQQGTQALLRIFIDSPNGVNISDCSKVSRQIGAMLDVERPTTGQYVLEVSSPGIDRPLFELAHFQKFIGSTIKIRLHSPINQRRQYKGILSRVDGENIHLVADNNEVVIPFTAIDKANIIAEVNL